MGYKLLRLPWYLQRPAVTQHRREDAVPTVFRLAGHLLSLLVVCATVQADRGQSALSKPGFVALDLKASHKPVQLGKRQEEVPSRVCGLVKRIT